jgi:hypothetical protein
MENNNYDDKENLGNSYNNIVVLGDDGVIMALFNSPRTVESIYEELLESGYKKEDIDLVMSPDTQSKYLSNVKSSDNTNFGNKSVEALGIGAAIGGSVGALAAALVAAGTTLTIPPLGIIVSGGLAASLAGAGAGAAAGGIIGTLVGLGIPDEQAKILSEGVKKGGIVMAVKTRSDEERQELNNKWSELQHNDSASHAA